MKPAFLQPRIVGWTLTAFATWAAVFVLPYRFPISHRVLSDTWVAGGNNQVAALALILLSLLITLILTRTSKGMAPLHTSGTLPVAFLYTALLAALSWTALLGAAVIPAHIYWGDAGYFLTQLNTGLNLHGTLYRDFEFAYGPILFYWPALWLRMLAHLGISAAAAYLVSFALFQALGVALLFYTVRVLPMRRSLQAAAFLLLSFGTFTSLLGLNYSLFRFILPLACIVFIARRQTTFRAALAAPVAVLLCLAVSPELGIALATAVLTLCVLSAAQSGFPALAPALASLAAAALYARFLPAYAFFTPRHMAAGSFNLLLTPAPHILCLLAAAVALGPIAVSRAALARAHRAPILGLYLVSLGLLPAALGRCDPIHIFFNGMGFYLLSFVTLDRASAPARRLAVTTVVAVFLLTQVANFQLYRERFGLLLGHVPFDPLEGIHPPALYAALAGRPVSVPLLAPQPVLEELSRRRQLVPGFFCGWVGIWDTPSEQRLISDMRRTPLALVPLLDPPQPDPAYNRRVARALRLGFAASPPRTAFPRGALLLQELNTDWQPVGIFGGYILFRKLR